MSSNRLMPMRTLVVGGHTRNIGKTALVVDIIRAFPEAAWTAVKITQHGHGVCSIDGKDCDCAPVDHGFALDEEQDRSNRTDSSRFLVAGAARSLWVRTRQGCLGDFLPCLLNELQPATNVIMESNSVLELILPTLYLVVLDPNMLDFKDSCRQFFDRADACILRNPLAGSAWFDPATGGPPISRRQLEDKRVFEQPLGGELPAELTKFIWQRFFTHSHPIDGHSADICC